MKNGRPGFQQVTGHEPWEYLRSNPQEASIFNQAMRDLSASISPAVAASFDWSRYPVIADIGGGIGSQLSSILDAHPACRGILFDQPATVAEAPEDDRIERVGGDFFKEIPVQADAYVMRWILHDWSDDESVALLGNLDLNMMVMTTGRERTSAEFHDLLARAGFALEQVVRTPSPLSIVIAKPGE